MGNYKYFDSLHDISGTIYISIINMKYRKNSYFASQYEISEIMNIFSSQHDKSVKQVNVTPFFNLTFQDVDNR